MTDQPDRCVSCHRGALQSGGRQSGLEAHPEWLNIDYDWGPEGGMETPLGAAAHVGNRTIAEYLLEQGAPLTPVAAALLGLKDALAAFIDTDPANASAPGAHGIPLLGHAAFSGDVSLVEMLKARGNDGSGVSLGLIHAAGVGHTAMVAWMLDNGANVDAQNFQGKTALDIAQASGHDDIAALIQNRK